MKLWIDTETYSEVPIKQGTYKYVANTEMMVVTWAIDKEPVQLWDLTSDPAMPSDLAMAMLEAEIASAHNALFDRLVTNHHLPQYAIPLEKWRCTMVKALAHSLPGSLDKLCEILKVPQDKAKLKVGKELVKLFCKPRPKNSKIRRATKETHPAEWAQFLEYAKMDIDAMREVDSRLPSWNYSGFELDLWHLDQRINDRGFKVDLDLAESVIEAVAKEQAKLADKTLEITNGEVSSTTKRDALLEHILGEYLISLPDLQGSTLERRLADPDIPEGLKELLRIRLQASTTSTSKYKALVNGTTDGRLRGTLQFDGAGRTGRWSGRTFQPQNLPRYALDTIANYFDLNPWDIAPKHIEQYLDEGIGLLKSGAADLVFENIMALCSNAIRSCIVAPENRKLVVADLSNIEGRVLAWLADEEWKLNAFNEFDTGTGADLYKLAYAKSFRIEPGAVNKEQRQVGKVQELALGYEGGVGAFLTFSLAYNIDLEDMAQSAYESLPSQVYEEAAGFYDWTLKQKRSTFGLSREAFIVCDSFKRLWRYAHPNTASLWKELEFACIEAVSNPGTTIYCRKFKVRRDGAWLRIGLPSGRALCYPQPQLENGKLSYMGMNQYTRQWSRIKTYGGKLIENCCQAVARDVMASNMQQIENAGFDITLTVHDEIICEAEDRDLWNEHRLAALMSRQPDWAEGLPLAAAGYEAYRYRKE